jgi:predicted protein tyrosine phosphatase
MHGNQSAKQIPMRHVLFLCSQNHSGSKTAEQVFTGWPGVEVASAGLDASAPTPVSPELLAWADTIFVMDKSQRARLTQKFRSHLQKQRVICLDIPGDFALMDPALVQLLRKRVPKHLTGAGSGPASTPQKRNAWAGSK